jgi:hypothetical protein
MLTFYLLYRKYTKTLQLPRLIERLCKVAVEI